MLYSLSAPAPIGSLLRPPLRLRRGLRLPPHPPSDQLVVQRGQDQFGVVPALPVGRLDDDRPSSPVEADDGVHLPRRPSSVVAILVIDGGGRRGRGGGGGVAELQHGPGLLEAEHQRDLLVDAGRGRVARGRHVVVVVLQRTLVAVLRGCPLLPLLPIVAEGIFDELVHGDAGLGLQSSRAGGNIIQDGIRTIRTIRTTLNSVSVVERRGGDRLPDPIDREGHLARPLQRIEQPQQRRGGRDEGGRPPPAGDGGDAVGVRYREAVDYAERAGRLGRRHQELEGELQPEAPSCPATTTSGCVGAVDDIVPIVSVRLGLAAAVGAEAEGADAQRPDAPAAAEGGVQGPEGDAAQEPIVVVLVVALRGRRSSGGIPIFILGGGVVVPAAAPRAGAGPAAAAAAALPRRLPLLTTTPSTPRRLPTPRRRRRRATVALEEAGVEHELAVRGLGIVEGPEGQAVAEGVEIEVALLPDLGQARYRGGEGPEGVGGQDHVHRPLTADC